MIATFKFPTTAKGKLWIQLDEAKRFLAVLKGEAPPNLPPPPTTHPAPAAALEWLGDASTILSSPMLSGITAAPTFDLPVATDWEVEYRTMWGIPNPSLYPSQPTNEKEPTTKPTT